MPILLNSFPLRAKTLSTIPAANNKPNITEKVSEFPRNIKKRAIKIQPIPPRAHANRNFLILSRTCQSFPISLHQTSDLYLSLSIHY